MTMPEGKTLTQVEALKAMSLFLEKYWDRGHSDEIAMLLGSLSLQPDGMCADAALWDDWIECVRVVLGNNG
jgi:hypothetical protein